MPAREQPQGSSEYAERYRAFFELTAIGASETGLPDGHYLRVNDALCALTGYSRDELLTMRFSDLTHPDEREASLERLRRLRDGELLHYSVERRLVRKNGEVIWVHIEVSAGPPDHRGLPAYAISVLRDITEQRRAEDALRENHERYQLATSSGRVSIAEWDADTDTISPGDRTLVGLVGLDPWEQRRGREWIELIHPADRARVTSVWSSVAHGTASSADVEFRMLTEDGQVIWLQSRFSVRERTGERVRRILSISVDITERKLAEEAVLASEERYRAFFEFNAVGACEVSLPDGKFIRVNDALCDMTGYSRDELLRMSVLDPVHGDDMDAVTENVKRLVRGELRTYTVERRIVRKDGEAIWIQLDVTAGPRNNGPPEYALGIVQDISERRRAADVLEEVNQRYKLATSAGRVIVWEWDAGTAMASIEAHGPSGVPRYSEPVVRSVPDFFALVHPEDRERVLATLTPVATGATEGAECEYRVVEEDGTVLWVYTRCRISERRGDQVARILGISVDVTARQRAEEAQRLSDERYRAFFELSAVGARECDLTKGRFLRVNDALCRMTGYSREELLQMSIADITHPDDLEADAERFPRLVAGELPTIQLEKRYVRMDGETVWVYITTTLIKDAAGTPVSEIGLAVDITERKRAVEEAQRLASHLLQAQDEERQRIAHGLHDQSAQALVASNLNLANFLQRHPELADDDSASLRESLALGEKVLGEIRTLSYVLHPPLLEELGLRSALAWFVEGFQRRSGIAMELSVPPDLGRLPPDVETALYRVVQESLQNILQHSGSAQGSIRLARDDTSIILEVEDQGHGIEVEARGASEHVEARGVGIAGMRERLHQLGGHLDIHSGPTGTTITAVVPSMALQSRSSEQVTP
jgi:PAS domain S-box-containing protein